MPIPIPNIKHTVMVYKCTTLNEKRNTKRYVKNFRKSVQIHERKTLYDEHSFLFFNHSIIVITIIRLWCSLWVMDDGPYAQVNALTKSSNVYNVFMEIWIKWKTESAAQHRFWPPHNLFYTYIYSNSILSPPLKSFLLFLFFFSSLTTRWYCLIVPLAFVSFYYYGKESPEKSNLNVVVFRSSRYPQFTYSIHSFRHEFEQKFAFVR